MGHALWDVVLYHFCISGSIDGLADGRRGVRCDECAKDDGCDEEYGSPRAEFEHRAPY